jgi:lysophospholipase L1-like esterase
MGMTWDCLNKVVDKNVSEPHLAKLIVIQLGSNDLGINSGGKIK